MKQTFPKSTQAYQLIRELILSGAKLPGTRLVVSDLEQELGIGASPLRDALNQLAQSSLIKIVPYRGAIVNQIPSLHELNIIYNLRISLEVTLIKAAKEHITSTEIQHMEILLSQMKNLSSENFVSLDKEFHSIIHKAAKMETCVFISDRIFDTVEVFLRAYPPSKQECIDSLAEHEMILNWLKGKDENINIIDIVHSNIMRGLKTIEEGALFYGHPALRASSRK